jgi:hypothetical protein
MGARSQGAETLRRVHTRHDGLHCSQDSDHKGPPIRSTPPSPPQLLLGWCNGRPIHVVAAENSSKEPVIVITVYEPTLDKWEQDLKTRRKHP